MCMTGARLARMPCPGTPCPGTTFDRAPLQWHSPRPLDLLSVRSWFWYLRHHGTEPPRLRRAPGGHVPDEKRRLKVAVVSGLEGAEVEAEGIEVEVATEAGDEERSSSSRRITVTPWP